MKHRVALLVAVVAGAGAFAVGPAQADFHGLCTAGSAPTARVGIILSGSTLTYTGTARCDGTSVSIDSISFSAWEGDGRTTGSAPAMSCTACTGPVTSSGAYTVDGPGTYAVSMTFSVRTSTGAVVTRLRTQRAAWAGTGNLVALCGGGDQGNQQNSCPVPEATASLPASADDALPHEL